MLGLGQGQDLSLPLCVITSLVEKARTVQRWQQPSHLSWTPGCFKRTMRSRAEKGGQGLESLGNQMGGHSCCFSVGHGEPQKALELAEEQAKWAHFKCVPDKGSAMGLGICSRIHKVCCCGLENSTQRLWAPTLGGGPHHLCASVLVPSRWML